jgi:5-formyltetrahydrofolate cyclo-ligase
MTEPVNPNSAQRPGQALRNKLRKLRRDIGSRQRAQYDQAIRQHLLELIESRAILSFAAFWPFDGEPDMIPLYRQLLDEGVEIALPKIAANGHNLELQVWGTDLTLEKNRFGIPEPGNTEKISLSTCPLLIMPLVGYDRLGNRLGVGAGYYDRHLESMRDSPLPLRVGVAYSLQEIEPLKQNDWDIPLHGVVNESGWFPFAL